jgi:hypothetical protein
MKRKLFFFGILALLAIFLIGATPVNAIPQPVDSPSSITAPVYGPAAPVLQEGGEEPDAVLEYLIGAWDQIVDILKVSAAGIPLFVYVLIGTLWVKATNLAPTDDSRRWWAFGIGIVVALVDSVKTLTTYNDLSAVIIAETLLKGITAAMLGSLVYKLPKFWTIFTDFVKSRQPPAAPVVS